MKKWQLKDENEILKAKNEAYKAMLKKVKQYGLPLTKEENMINDMLIKEVNREKKNG